MTRPIVAMVAGRDPIAETGGGHSTFVRAHARAALRAGYEPHLFCAGAEGGEVATDFGTVHRSRSPWWWLPQIEGVGVRSNMVAWHVPMLVASLGRFLAANPDVALVHGFGVWGCVGVRVCRKFAADGGRARGPIVSAYTSLGHEYSAKWQGISWRHGLAACAGALRDLAWFRMSVARYERTAFRGSRFVLVNYESVRRRLAQEWGESLAFRKMPYAAETSFVTSEAAGASQPQETLAGRTGPGPLVLAVSRHDPRKGVDVLLRALASLRSRGVPFHACLVGGGLLLEAHRRLARELRLDGLVWIEGYVPDVRPYLRQADVFVLPSLQEGSGSIALIEALEQGLPIVASGVDGIPEDVTNEESALLVPPGDEGALAAALERIAGDRELRERLQRRSGEVFRRKFEPSGLVDALRELYGEASTGPAQRRSRSSDRA